MKCRLVVFGALVALARTVGAQEVSVTAASSGRMPARGSSIVVKVRDYSAAREQVLAAARREGAELLDGRTIVNGKGKVHGWMNLRLSADRIHALQQSIRAAGVLHSEALDTTDNLSEYEELEKRVSRLRQHEERLDGLLKSSRRLRGSDILYIQERLFRAGVDQDILRQERLDLERAARTASLNVTLFEPGALPVPPGEQVDIGAWFKRGTASAWLSLQRLVARASTGAAFLLVFAPLWIPALVLAIVLIRRFAPGARRAVKQVQIAIRSLIARPGIIESGTEPRTA